LLASDEANHAEFLHDVFHPVGAYPLSLVIDQLAQYGLDATAYRTLVGGGWDDVRLVSEGGAMQSRSRLN
jgi:hypothetical protein